jgi:hypothetical protein
MSLKRAGAGRRPKISGCAEHITSAPRIASQPGTAPRLRS